jgi:hypothetical protein
MRDYLRGMKHVIEFTAILAALLVGMTFVVAGNVNAAPAGNNATLGVAAVVPPRVLAVLESNNKPNFNRPNFNKLNFNKPNSNPAFNRPFFNRPAFNPFFVRPAFNPFFNVDVDAFGADFD